MELKSGWRSRSMVMLKAVAAEEKARKRAKKRRVEALESMFDNCECISNMKPKPLLFSFQKDL